MKSKTYGVTIGAAGVNITGDLDITVETSIGACITGNVKSTHQISMLPHSRITGDVTADILVIDAAEVRGNINARRVYIRTDSRVTGDITAETLSVDEGAIVAGKFDIKGEPVPVPAG